MTFLEKIPTVVTVAVLVGIFASLKRHARSPRLELWMTGWFLVFAHFVVQLLEPATGSVSPRLLALDLGALQASAVAFLTSVAVIVENKVRRRLLLLFTGVPSVAYAVIAAYDVQSRWPYVVSLVACFGAGIAFFLYVHRKFSTYIACMVGYATLVGSWTIWHAAHGQCDQGLTALLATGFALPGVFICRNFWRRSPGIITIAIGFFCWGAVFPAGLFLYQFAPTLNIPAELWNTPKLFVAFGMILAIVEEKSASIECLQRKEHALNRQLESFSNLTSRLLSGANVDVLCDEIAEAIVEVSNFGVAAIMFDTGGVGLRLAGANGLTAEKLNELRAKAKKLSTDDIKAFCSRARRLGQNSFVLSRDEAAKCDPVRSELEYPSNPYWSTGDLLIIPLCSARGGYLGCLALDDPRDVELVNAQELSRIELLAADLAVAVEMKSLQGQLMRSEKLAALGQLVAGVAHELNNPLTAVMGYGELMSDDLPAGSMRERMDKLVNEARRMKKIVDNLLRFSRPTAGEPQPVYIVPLVQDVLALREYYLRTHGVGVIVDVRDGLPAVTIDEDHVKQVLLNLLNNAIDAVETGRDPKAITLRAFQRANRIVIQVEDSGPGFANLNRAFDPFYTTKPIGKGTGLGLSICYGIVKENDGDIKLENLQPHGARVTVDLPVAEETTRDRRVRRAAAGAESVNSGSRDIS